MTPSDQQVIFTRLDYACRFIQDGRHVRVEEHGVAYPGWEIVGNYLTKAKTPGGLMRSASRWLAQNRWEQLQLPMPTEVKEPG